MARFPVLLALLVLLSAAVAAQGRHPGHTPGALTPDRQPAREIYRELIEINPSNTRP